MELKLLTAVSIILCAWKVNLFFFGMSLVVKSSFAHSFNQYSISANLGLDPGRG